MNHYNQLTIQDRCKFNTLLDMSWPMTKIAKRMGIHRSTLYRELARNREGVTYKPGLAHRKAMARKNRKCYIQLNPTLQSYINRHIKKGWSPEQISGRLKRKKSKYVICHETIYRYIYKHQYRLHRYLPYKKSKRLKPCGRKPRKCRFGENHLITKRPEYITKRIRSGHWEGDLIEFKGNKQASVTTLVERKSRCLLLIKNETKFSEEVMGKIQNKFTSFQSSICKTITFDQGIEFSHFSLLERSLNCSVYYCHARSPWEKGSNENMNGRIRWSLPKDTNILEINQEQLDLLADKMNNTPRKCLDYRTPRELFLKLFKEECRTSL